MTEVGPRSMKTLLSPAETGRIPDAIIRAGIRMLCRIAFAKSTVAASTQHPKIKLEGADR
jgi:hypothetical protein